MHKKYATPFILSANTGHDLLLFGDKIMVVTNLLCNKSTKKVCGKRGRCNYDDMKENARSKKLYPHINVLFIHKITNQPANQHYAYSKKKRAKVSAGVHVNGLVQPFVNR